jgi:hypothetical protein
MRQIAIILASAAGLLALGYVIARPRLVTVYLLQASAQPGVRVLNEGGSKEYPTKESCESAAADNNKSWRDAGAPGEPFFCTPSVRLVWRK